MIPKMSLKFFGLAGWLQVQSLLVLGLTLSACSNADVAAQSRAKGKDKDSFFVLPDDTLDPFLHFIEHAKKSLDVYVFVLDNPEIEKRLVAAHQNGVAVRAIIEPNPGGRADIAQQTFDRLQKEGIAVRHANTHFVKTHAKTIIADKELALVATVNFTSEWETTRDYGIITHHPETVAALEAVYEADWNNQATLLELDPQSYLAISPINSRATVVNLLNAAKDSLHIEQEQLDDPAVLDLLAKRSQAGIKITMVLADKPENRTIGDGLVGHAPAIRLKYCKHPKIHAKIIIVDDKQMLVGSLNLTTESLDLRREISLLTDNADWIARAQASFKSDAHN